MAEPRVISFSVDLDKPIQKETKKELFATGDSNAHEFVGTVTRNGEAVDLSGMGVEATFLSMASGLSTHIDGTISNGNIVVKLTKACYHLAGNARLSIALKKGDFHLTVFSCEMMMTATGSSIVYDPDAVIPSISDLIRKVDELEERVEEVNENIPGDISSVANVIATVNQNSASISVLQTDVNTAKSDAQSAVSKANTNATNISAVQKTANDNKADISSLSSRVATAETNISAANSNISAANSKLSTVEGKANTNASDISNLKTTVAGHTSNISSLRNDVDDANATAETAEQTATSAKTLVQTLQNTVNTNLENLRETLADHEEDIGTNAGNIAKLNANALMKGGHVAGKWFAADENGTITQVTAPDSAVTPEKIRDALGYTPVSVESLNREIDELDAKKVNRTGLPTNKILGSSDAGDLRYFDFDVGVTAQSIQDALGYVPADVNNVSVTADKIEEALGYKPADANNVTISAAKIKDALGYVPAKHDELVNTTQQVWEKLDEAGHEPGKFLATDSSGKVVTVDPPSGGTGGGIPPTGPFQMLVTNDAVTQVWEERTHYPYIGRVTILPEVDYSTIDYVGNTLSQDIAPYMQGEIVAGKTYYVTFGTEEFECLAYKQDTYTTVIAENNDWLKGRFSIRSLISGERLLMVNDGGANPKTTIKVEGPGIAYKKLDPAKYLPEGYPYVEHGEVTVFEASWTAEEYEAAAGELVITEPLGAPFTAGNTYIVTWCGVEYECECVEFSPFEGVVFLALGNIGWLFGGEDTGEPFAVAHEASMQMTVVQPTTEPEFPVFISVTTKGEVIHPMDEKFLPKTSGGSGNGKKITITKDDAGNYTTDTRLVDVYDMPAAELQAAITAIDGRWEMGVFGLSKSMYGGSVPWITFYVAPSDDTLDAPVKRIGWLGNAQFDQIGYDGNFDGWQPITQ